MTQSVQLDADHLRSWVGREESVDADISVELAGKFAATFNLTGDFRPGDVAPAMIHFCLGQQPAPTALLGTDGHPARGGFLPPVPLPRRMWAGGSLVFHKPLRIGDPVTRRSRIADVTVKQGRAGILCFVAVEHRIVVAGEEMITERQDIVYRGNAGVSKDASSVPAPAGEHRRGFDPLPTALFRYSALTFNGHRIHYDRAYAMNEEGYPGLVVHGPLQATLLYMLAAELRGVPPLRFSFRSQSPLFDGTPFGLHARDTDGVFALWTAAENGPVAMAAEARWT
ncbi:MaoC family dehydratase N-terminal domain-containing protein [Sinorhizobium meliloti]|uniref:FAS1-like dehydratase domain-containing protein n=1 Tax=Rhizobium meliloti TaxID=382 RepID=UPI00398D5734